MKINCPNCNKVLQAPDEWKGKKVKCPGCKRMIVLPGNKTGTPNDLSLDLESLGKLESAGQKIVRDRKSKPMTLKEAQAANAAANANQEMPEITDYTVRTCPQCGQKVKCDDLFCEVMCRHCGTGIPAPQLDGKKTAEYKSGMTDRVKTNIGFYTGFTSACIYPIPGIASIILGMALALGTIALPMLAALAFSSASSLNPVGSEEISFDWVGVFLTVMFAIQGIYFGAVAYYAMIDTIRSTSAGNEQPPNLTWNVLKLGAALAGYVALIALYAIIILVLLVISKEPPPDDSLNIANLAKTGNIIVLALLTFIVPMNIIGLSSSHALDGLNPARVGVSIGRLIGHYIFLFLIMIIFLGMSVGVMIALMSWAQPLIMHAAEQGIKEGFWKMIGGLGAWSIVIGAGFYFAYAIGRILGLFARDFRKELDFDL
ncbi:MAG: hypothetical protein ACYTF1_13225 [Planctomycetota bacterium]|jgi:hypothetical protein